MAPPFDVPDKLFFRILKISKRRICIVPRYYVD